MALNVEGGYELNQNGSSSKKRGEDSYQNGALAEIVHHKREYGGGFRYRNRNRNEKTVKDVFDVV